MNEATVPEDAETVFEMDYLLLRDDQYWNGQYTGQIKDGLPEGNGTFTSLAPKDGNLWHYIGGWKEGLPEGEGTIYYDNGDMETGVFTKGVLTNGQILISTGTGVKTVFVEMDTEQPTEVAYIGNKKSKKFHYPDCRGVKTMKESNKVELFSREEAEKLGFTPCGTCNP